MREIAKAMRQVAARHDDIAEWMERDQISGVSAKNFKTSVQSLVHLSKFLGNVVSAYCDNVHASGVAEVEGGLAVLIRYLNRTADGLSKDAEDVRADVQDAVDRVKKGRGDKDGDGKSKKPPPKP